MAQGDGAFPYQGLDTWSESIMVICYDDALKNGFSLRLARYPDHAASWLWCHVIMDGRMYAYTAQHLPSEARHIGPDTPSATYRIPGVDVRMTREGTAADLTSITFEVSVLGREGLAGLDGPGDVPISLSGVFQPGKLKAGSPAGRFERTGQLEAVITVAGHSHPIATIAKAHEQTQTRPRFTPPFAYAMLWSPSVSLVGLMSGVYSYGDYETGVSDTPIERFRVEARAPRRRFTAQLAGGRLITGLATAAFSYEVPVFDRMWRGNIVSAEIEGHRLVGAINDWRAEDQPYGL